MVGLDRRGCLGFPRREGGAIWRNHGVCQEVDTSQLSLEETRQHNLPRDGPEPREGQGNPPGLALLHSLHEDGPRGSLGRGAWTI